MDTGEVSALIDKMPVGGFVDYEHHQYVTPKGVRLDLKPLSKLVLERLYNSQDGKPKVPMVEVTIGGQYKRNEPNPDDPAYKQAMDEWQSAKNIGLAKYLFVNGIWQDPPEEFTAEYHSYSPCMIQADIKYLWVISLMGDTDEEQMEGMGKLSEALTGQIIPTEKGMRKAEESFRSDGGGNSGDAVPDGAIAG